MAMLTAAERKKLADELLMPWGSTHLLCDGHVITLQVRRFSTLSFRVMTYVDGFFKHAWAFAAKGKSPAPETKFLRTSVRPHFSPAKLKEAVRRYGKRAVSKDPYWSGSQTFYLPDWSSGKAAINHLCKVCDSVEVCEAPGTLPTIVASGEPTNEEINN